MQIIYYGSYCEEENPEIREGEFTKDLGTGFYLLHYFKGRGRKMG